MFPGRLDALLQLVHAHVLRLEDDAPPGDDRAIFNVDIVDPCWVWRDVDLAELHAVGTPNASAQKAQLTASAVNVGGLAVGALVIGALIAGAFFTSTQEYRIGRNSLVDQRAFSAAEAGRWLAHKHAGMTR